MHTRNLIDHENHGVAPPPDVFKINIAASFKKSFYLAGIAMIVRNSTGIYVAGKGILKRVIHANQAETWVLLEAMLWAKVQAWEKVIFESDCKNLVLFINTGLTLPPWQSSSLLNRCVSLFKDQSNWSCKFVPKVCNKTTDCLAKSVRKLCYVGEWWHEAPANLLVNLASDVS